MCKRILLIVGLGLYVALPAIAQTPRASCTDGLTGLAIKLGDGIPLPRQYSNPTSQSVTFTLTMESNPIFGPRHVVRRKTIPAHMGESMSESPVHFTWLRTPVGKTRVTINITTNRTGATVVGSCDYQLTLAPPPGVPGKIPRRTPPLTAQQLSWLYQIPVRMCVLEGSQLAGTKKAGDTIDGREILDLLESVNNDIWFPEAQIAFSSPIEMGIPVVADPTPPPGRCGSIGDLSSAGFGGADGPFAENACANAWATKYPGKVGIPIIFARNFCESGAALAAAPGAPKGLQVQSPQAFSGERGDDLCGIPQRLTRADIINDRRRPFVIAIEPKNLMNGNVRNALAHELGHNLFLGHGNGLDDNGDGVRAGRLGPKRYDEYCDPQWLRPPGNTVLVEDDGVPFENCERSGSLMQRTASCAVLRPLQIETARGVARIFPGFVDTTPKLILTQ